MIQRKENKTVFRVVHYKNIFFFGLYFFACKLEDDTNNFKKRTGPATELQGLYVFYLLHVAKKTIEESYQKDPLIIA